MKLTTWLHGLLASMLALGAGAASAAKPPGPDVVADSYLVTFRPTSGNNRSPIVPPNDNGKKRGFDGMQVPFGEASTGQDKKALAAELGIQGEVAAIWETINAAHIKMSAAEAEKLRNNPKVERVSPNVVSSLHVTQSNPGWALDRLDQPTGMNGQYNYNADGTGRIIVVVDSGINLGIPAVAAEFTGPGGVQRAQMFYDFNANGTGTGADCNVNSHGTKVASAAAGNTYGIAKGSRVLAIKFTMDCTGGAPADRWITVLNFMAANAPRGTIINISSGYEVRDAVGNPVCSGWLVPEIETAIRTAHDAGMIVVVSAGNDGCDTGNYTPTRIAEAFVVGATDNYLIPAGRDVRALYNQGASRFGSNISTFSPGANVMLMNRNGSPELSFGTSFAAPYVSGIFAAACQVGGTFCDTMPTAASIYNVMRGIATMNTVVDQNGMPPPGGTPQRFITRGPW